MPALGEEFRRAREARGQSISDVAERLHIRSVYLSAIEDEDWAAIGAPVYIRGFMRTYARYLGLDPEAAVARLAEPAPAPATTRGPAAPAPVTSITEERSGRRTPSIPALLALAVAVVLVGVVAYQYGQYRNAGTGAPPVATVSPAAAASAAPEVVPSDAPAADATPLVAPAPAPVASEPQLGIALTETSWLRVVVDGKLALEGTFPAGTAKTFTGKAATVRIGNAGGVRIAIDGRPVGKLGGDGDVVERRFVLTGE